MDGKTTGKDYRMCWEGNFIVGNYGENSLQRLADYNIIPTVPTAAVESCAQEHQLCPKTQSRHTNIICYDGIISIVRYTLTA